MTPRPASKARRGADFGKLARWARITICWRASWLPPCMIFHTCGIPLHKPSFENHWGTPRTPLRTDHSTSHSNRPLSQSAVHPSHKSASRRHNRSNSPDSSANTPNVLSCHRRAAAHSGSCIGHTPAGNPNNSWHNLVTSHCGPTDLPPFLPLACDV